MIFRTHSDIEAQIVRGPLESHGVMTVVASDVPHSIFPLSVDGLSEVRISVHPAEAQEAQRIIEGHRTELKNGQVVRLRDEFEALQQAIGYRFRDRGLFEHARAFIVREFGPLFEEARRDGVAGQDYKSALQELLQSRDLPLPEYRLVGTAGPDHRKLFEIELLVKGDRLATATGPSKKEAEQDAARLALDALRANS